MKYVNNIKSTERTCNIKTKDHSNALTSKKENHQCVLSVNQSIHPYVFLTTLDTTSNNTF